MPELRVQRGDAGLAATFTPGGATALVALHGASKGTRDYRLYRHLHELLPRTGIGVVTFDRRGEGDSTGEPSVGRFELQAADALAVAAATEAERIGLWGFSQGAWGAPLAATMAPRVSFLGLIASTGVTPAEQMRYAVAQQLQRAGFGEDVVERALALRQDLERTLVGDVADARVLAELRDAGGEPWWPLAFLPDAPPDEAERAEIAKELFFEPEPVFASVNVPTLLLYGDDDTWTPVEPSIAAWRRARGDAVDVRVLAGTGHEPLTEDGHVAPAYEQELLSWLAAHAR